LVETDRQIHDLLIFPSDESQEHEGSFYQSGYEEIAVNKGHMSALQLKHAELEEQLELENARPLPDDDLIHRIKKQKLHIKDMLSQELAAA
jgi:hypothetical protein